MNAPFSRAVSSACLTVMGALCYVVALLLAILLATSLMRGDGPQPVPLFVAAAIFVIAGAACRRLSRMLLSTH